jgi:hypothetical protein
MDLDQTINASDVTSVATVVSGTVIHDTGLMSP